MAKPRSMKFLLMVSFCGVLASCGGGGGNDGEPAEEYSNASLTGRYYGNHFNFNVDGWQSAIEAATFDGNGGVQVAQQYSYYDTDAATGGTATASVTATYDVDVSGSVAFGQEGQVTNGMVGAGANAIVAARNNATDTHNLSFFIKAPSPGSWTGGLSGSYHAIGFRHDRTDVVRLAFDPDGTFDATAYYTDELDIRKPETGGGTWVIDADGRATVTRTGGSSDPVWFSADGTLFVTASVNDASEQKIFIGMRAGSGHSAADLEGTYAFAKLSSRRSCVLGTLTFDGRSGVSVHGTYSDRTSTGTADLVGTYSVNSDGTFSITIEGETALDGVMSADGKTMAFARMDDTRDHSIGVGVRR